MNIRKVHAWYCPSCEQVYAHDIGTCPECESGLDTLSFTSIEKLNEHIKQIEDDQRNRGLSTRMPGMRFTCVEAELFAAFEKRNRCILFAEASRVIPTIIQDDKQTSEETLPVNERNIFFVWERVKWQNRSEAER